jgi:hypothetical protein
MNKSLKHGLRIWLQTLIIVAFIVPFYSATNFGLTIAKAADNEYLSMTLKTDYRGGTLQNIYVPAIRERTGVNIWKRIVVKVYSDTTNPTTSSPIASKTYLGDRIDLTNKTPINYPCSDNPTLLCGYLTGFFDIKFDTPVPLNASQNYLVTVETAYETEPGKKVGSVSFQDIIPSIFSLVEIHSPTQSSDTIDLEWKETGGVKEYEIYKESTLLTTTQKLSYQVTGLASGTSYPFSIVGVDYAGKKTIPVTVEVATKRKMTTPPNLSKSASNIHHAYDKNVNTSGNILKSDGYIIFKLSDLGLAPGEKSTITMATSGEETHSIKLELLDDSFEMKGSTDITASRNKGDYPIVIHSEANYVKVSAAQNAKLYIYEITKGLAQTPFGKAASNLTHAFDHNIETSANILYGDGFITYKLSDLGLTTGLANLTMATSGKEIHSIKVEYFDEGYERIGDTNITASRNKGDYTISVPPNTYYLNIIGTPNAKVYIYEIGTGSPSEVGLVKGVSNLTHGSDGNINTSANILTNDGYITYKLTDIGLTSGGNSTMVIGTSNGEIHQIRLDFFNEEMELKDSTEITVSGFKGVYQAIMHPDVFFVKINAIPSAKVYLYEIGPVPSMTKELVKGSSNLTHSYDGSITTSANILTNDGYITYKLADIGLTEGEGTVMIIGSSNGATHSLRIDYLNESLELKESSELTITGFKNEYRLSVHPEAYYIRFNGTNDAMVFLYEVNVSSSGQSPSSDLSRGANNLSHAHDGNINTSGNILTTDGFITYKLNEVGLTAGADITMVIGTSNGETHQMKIDFLDEGMETKDSIEITVSGFKNENRIRLHPEAVYVRFNATPAAKIYIYELNNQFSVPSESTPIVELWSGASNMGHAYDGNYNTSGNILTDNGYIIYRLDEIGLRIGAESTFTIGTSDAGSHIIQVDYLGDNSQIFDSISLPVDGHKNDYQAGVIPEGVTHVRIDGIVGAFVYLYEMKANE